MPKWTTEEERFLIENYSKYSQNELCDIFDREPSTIRKKAESLGIRKESCLYAKYTQDEDNIIISEYPNNTAEELMELLPGRTISSIHTRATKLGVRSNPYVVNRIYSYNYNFFSIPNNQNSYWAGFIAADGCVKTERAQVSITLSEKDISQLEAIKSEVEYTGPIRTYKGNSGYRDDFTEAKIDFSSAHKWVIDLKNNFNISDRKTFDLVPPPLIDLDNKLCYIAGFLDGDGSIWYHYYKKKNGEGRTTTMGFLGTYEMMYWVRETLSELNPEIEKLTIGKVKKVNGNLYIFNVSGKKLRSIQDRLINLECYHMPRKWDRLQ